MSAKFIFNLILFTSMNYVQAYKSGNFTQFSIKYLEYHRDDFIFSLQKWFPHCNTMHLNEACSQAITIFAENLKRGELYKLDNQGRVYVMAIAKKLLTDRKNSTMTNVANTCDECRKDDVKIGRDKKQLMILECIDQLNPLARKMLKLLLIDGKNIQEVAQVMNFGNFQIASTAKDKFILKLKNLVAKKLLEWERNESET